MKIIMLFLMFFSLMGCQKIEESKIIEDNSQDFLKAKINTGEVYSDIYLNDLYEIVNPEIEIKTANTLVDTTKLGHQNIVVNYVYQDKLYAYKQDLEIKDTTPPRVFSGVNKTVNVNYDKDLCNLITYGDNYTGDVKCYIEGYYDLAKEGTYNLIYSLKDSSNNVKEVKVTLNVQKPKPLTNTGTSKPKEKTLFTDIYNEFKTSETEIGIDISKWQGEIDFNKVKNAGASFVIIRLGRQGTSTKALNVDEYFQENLKKAKEAGLKVGVYLYSVATSNKEAKEQAKFVLDNLKGEQLDLPIVFDWESWANWNSYKISFYEINDIANTYMQTVKDAGYEGMLYSSKSYLESIWTNKKEFPVWLAHYTKKTNYEGAYSIWQLCNNGSIDGINGDVDIDILYK